jgi:membrane-associated phospholipid phosphatase
VVLPATCGGQEAGAASASAEESGGSPGVLGALTREATVYFDDTKALFVAPFSWNTRQAGDAVGAGLAIGVLVSSDPRTATSIQNAASGATNQMSKIVTPLGSWAAFAASGGLIATGLIARDSHLSTMGRDALEACLLAGLFTDIGKPLFGRSRPYQSDNQNVFKPFSGNTSFPSGHATVAFAFASVISARSDGWVIPTVSYTLASLVAYSRVNDSQHFVSDVVAGGLIGVTVGRFLVHRHERAEAEGKKPTIAEINVFAIPRGLGLSAKF